MNQKKVLTKSSTNRWLFGVLGGFAEYFNIDPTLLRVGFLLFSLLPGPSVIIYIICALIMPSADNRQ
ncbi:PspC domain-containing protein [Proteiniclasticum sp.]|uniref:PspC domain-containing protein n=1 Tax=Proteiniclasticum sp. TaxID=2053595 RepID=UPI0028A18EE1|nr:PspC domain-containing protein [Proteiniclasticum sp.]